MKKRIKGKAIEAKVTSLLPMIKIDKRLRSTVSVVIPAFNEEKNITNLIRNLKKLGYLDEIIIVNDGSQDKTAAVIGRIRGIKVINHPYNIGNGAAIKSGFREARGDVIVTMDADGQHNPNDIARLIAEIFKGYDMVVGARSGQYQATWYRNIANKVYNALARYVTKFQIQDLTSGMRAVRADFAKSIIYLLPNTFSYPTTITMALLRCGRSLKYVPIKVRNRKKGKSKIKIFSDGARFLMIIIKIATLFSPMRIFLPIAGLFALGGVIYSAFTLWQFHKFTNLGGLLLSTAILIFLIGLISEQISQLRMDRSEADQLGDSGGNTIK